MSLAKVILSRGLGEGGGHEDGHSLASDLGYWPWWLVGLA